MVGSVGGHRSECLGPRRPDTDRLLGEGAGALLDEVAALVESSAHVGGHRSAGFGDEADDEPCGPCPATGDSAGCELDAVPQNGGDVVDIIEIPAADCNREDAFDIVAVGLGATELGGEGSERIGVEHLVELLRRKAARTQKNGPAVVLGSRGDELRRCASVWWSIIDAATVPYRRCQILP